MSRAYKAELEQIQRNNGTVVLLLRGGCNIRERLQLGGEVRILAFGRGSAPRAFVVFDPSSDCHVIPKCPREVVSRRDLRA